MSEYLLPLTAGNAQFVLQSLKELSSRGIHTAVDTCGQISSDLLLEAAELADLILYDLKIMDYEKHRKSTGTGNERIHKNLH
jgi:pyruvate-formate lyase-activating enzyme